jgi:hypothetical protein
MVQLGGRNGFTPFDADNPKRHDFEYNFLGHRNKATMDEQMSGIIKPGMQQPKWYAPAEEAVHQFAAREGVDPRFAQEVMWAGNKKLNDVKGVYTPKPMIQIGNEAIERTRRITGLSADDVVDGIVKGTIPVYKRGGLASCKARSN